STKRLIDVYHPSIPLFEKGRGFDKLAKLSIPIAILCGSFTEQEGQLVLTVDTHHVQYAVEHLESTYNSPHMGYDTYSHKTQTRETILDSALVRRTIEECLEVTPVQLISHLLNQHLLTRLNLEELIGERMIAAKVWSVFMSNHCLEPGTNLQQFTKTRAFIDL